MMKKEKIIDREGLARRKDNGKTHFVGGVWYGILKGFYVGCGSSILSN